MECGNEISFNRNWHDNNINLHYVLNHLFLFNNNVLRIPVQTRLIMKYILSIRVGIGIKI